MYAAVMKLNPVERVLIHALALIDTVLIAVDLCLIGRLFAA